MEPRSRASPEQFCFMIEFMERYGDLSRPQSGPQAKIKADKLWQELTTILNSLGGDVQKSSHKWKKVWADWKTKTKKKFFNLRLQASGTGGGPSSTKPLTVLEERVVAVIGMSAVAGQAGIREHGFDRTPNEPHNYEAGGAHTVSGEHNENNDVATTVSPIISCVSALPRPQHTAGHSTPQVILAASPLGTPASPPSPSQAPPPPPPPPRTPPTLYNRRQMSASPRSTATTPRRALLRARRNRGLTPFERATDQFAAVEQRRLQQEEARDKRLHEREMERLRLEAERIEVTRQQNVLLHQLYLGERLIDVITRQPVDSLPSTDSL